MQTELHSAFLLHRRNYRESSLLLELFSSRYGRVGAIARGATRSRVAAGPALQPFRPLLVSWTSRRSELMTLTHCDPEGPLLLGAGPVVLCGFYLNELILQALPRSDPHADLFTHYGEALRALDSSPSSVESVLRIFEKHLLDAIGYGLTLDREVSTQASVSSGAHYVYVLGRGPLPETSENREEGIVVSGSTLLALARERFDSPAQLGEAKHLMRVLLRWHLGDKPLHSRAWLEEY